MFSNGMHSICLSFRLLALHNKSNTIDLKTINKASNVNTKIKIRLFSDAVMNDERENISVIQTNKIPTTSTKKTNMKWYTTNTKCKRFIVYLCVIKWMMILGINALCLRCNNAYIRQNRMIWPKLKSFIWLFVSKRPEYVVNLIWR